MLKKTKRACNEKKLLLCCKKFCSDLLKENQYFATASEIRFFNEAKVNNLQRCFKSHIFSNTDNNSNSIY